jgi:NADH:ubiquinone oxidoreductase subunit 6 (subunit J)
MTTPVQALQFVGLTSSIFLAGTYFSSSQLTLPILYRLPTATSTSVFSEFYYRGAIAVVPMAIVSTLSFGAVAYLLPEQRTTWGTAAIAPILTLPWTALIMMGTIQRWLKLDQDKVEQEKASTEEVVGMLKTWRWMNFVRGGMALVGGGVSAWTLVH